MNRADFARNFSHSYFGFLDTQTIKQGLFKETALDEYLLDGYVIPCNRPRMDHSKFAMWYITLKSSKEPNKYHNPPAITIHTWKDDEDENELRYMCGVPRSQMVQLEDTVVYLRRGPVRDTPRGYCPRHTTVGVISDDIVSNDRVSSLLDGAGSPEVVWNLYNPTIYTLPQALNAVSSGSKAAAKIATHLAVGLKAGRGNIQIFYKNRGSVGFFDDNGTPVIFNNNSNYGILEYVHKITGIAPREK